MLPRILLICALLPAVAGAQGVPFAAPARLESAGDPADRLAGYLRTLATSPRDVEALTGAGRAALDVGDANAAIGFYARADTLSPRDGRIKAGLGTALLRMGKAREALRLFDQATDLLVPEADIAAERGLAYDLRGDPKRAQRDYRLALAQRPDAEITRRLALSLAISGDREGAIQLLSPLLYKNDAAAWRARAFVLAMTGDAAGAGTIASAMMLPGQAAAMQPFLIRLAALDAADKARAVHFGEMPSDGTAYSQAELAGFGASTATRSYRPETAATRTAAATSPRVTVSPALSAATPTRQPTTGFLRNRQALLGAFSPRAAAAEVKAMPPVAAPAPVVTAGRTVTDEAPLMLALNLAAPSPKAEMPVEKPGLTAAEKRAADKAKADEARRKKDAAAKAAAKAAEAKAAKANPERIWVQVAGGANRGDLGKAWTTAKGKAGATLAGRSPSTATAGATNRVLVGPFKSRGDAQELVNKLPGAFIVTTEKGQPVAKLAL